jgi:hypothetical protein
MSPKISLTFTTSRQAKSGVSGIVYVVVPHIMGIAVFSPPLDSHGNSVRGVEFCKRLLKEFKYGVFDQIVSGDSSASNAQAGNSSHGVQGSRAPAGPGQMQHSLSARSKGALTARADLIAAGRHHSPAAGSPSSLHAENSQNSGGDPSGVSAVHVSGSSVPSNTAASAQRIEKARRIGYTLRRLSRSWMLLRAWSGLPVAPGDLEALQASRFSILANVCVCRGR